MDHSNNIARQITKDDIATFKQVVSDVQDTFCVSDIFRRSNSPVYTIPRSVVFFICIKRKGLKSLDVCELSGIKNHSSATYYLSLFEKEISRNYKFRNTTLKLLEYK